MTLLKTWMVIATAIASSATTATLAQPLAPAPKPAAPLLHLAGQCELVPFDGLSVDYHPRRGYLLTISGIKPYANMKIGLRHESYGGRRPAYWRTSVVGCVKNFIVFPIPSPYTTVLPLDTFVGTRGVEIRGANGSVRRSVPRG